MIATNKYQSVVDDKFFEGAAEEVIEQFKELVSTVPFIQNLIKHDRKYARDLERDEEGKIIVDICEPHILEDMDYFRQTAKCFLEHGKLTLLRPNGNENSEFGKWIREEIRRIFHGMVRPSDGEWIPGDMYFYLNYMPMEITQMATTGKSKAANRITSLPRVWEGAYLWFHYIHQARWGGKYDERGGKHCVQIATRGASKSYTCASMLARLFVCGDNEENKTNVRGVILAALKDTLTKDGTLNKFEQCIDFCAEYTQFPSQRLLASIDKMNWEMGYIDAEKKIKKGTRNVTLGVTTNDNPEKARGKRVTKLIYEEVGAFPKFLDAWSVNEPSVQEGDAVWGTQIAIGTGGSEGCLTRGNYVYDSVGNRRDISEIEINSGIIGYDIENQKYYISDIEHINTPTEKECVKLTTNNFRDLSCSTDHPIYASNRYDYNECRVWEWLNAGDLKEGDLVAIAQEVPVFGNNTLFDARLVGMLIGDGTYVESPRLISCDKEIHDYLKANYDTAVYGDSYTTKSGKECYTLGIKKIRNELRNLGIYGQSGESKRLPDLIWSSTKQDVSDLIAGLIDTDGNISIYEKTKGKRLPSCTVSISTAVLELAKEIRMLLSKLGVTAAVHKHNPSKKDKKIKDKNPWYSIEISSRDSIIALGDSVTLLLKYKQEALMRAVEISKNKKRHRRNKFEYETVKAIESLGSQTVYNLSASGKHTYLGNGIITHNSNFYGILEMLYNPKGYNVYPLPNVFDKNANGKGETIFFFGAYLNREGFYNKDGVSDVTGTILNILKRRHEVKYNSSDPTRITRVIAERPLTIQEAIMRRESSMFPAAALTDRVAELDLNPNEYDNVYTGKLSLNSQGQVDFMPTNCKVIRDFPHKDTNTDGGIEIFQMPHTKDGKPIPGRYIASLDPVDDDSSSGGSLQSGFVFDLWTDEIVAEYTGRPAYAEDYYEQFRLLLLFYDARCNYENNKKGLFGYFSKMNCVYLLTETLDFLKDKQLAKATFGNKSRGTVATAAVNNYARNLIRMWLIAPIEEEGDKDENVVVKPKLTKIRSRALLKELIQWEPLGNYDRVSALGMLMLLREDKMILFQGKVDPDKMERYNKTYLGNDDFFNTYDNKTKGHTNNNAGLFM